MSYTTSARARAAPAASSKQETKTAEKLQETKKAPAIPLPDWLNLKYLAGHVPVELLEPRGETAVYPTKQFVSGDNAKARTDIVVAKNDGKTQASHEERVNDDDEDGDDV